MTLDYGQSGGIDDGLSRVAAIHDSRAGSSVATFEHVSLSRRISKTLALLVSLSFVGDAGAYDKLDRFGRVTDMHYKNPAGYTLWRSQSAYDLSGNRLYDRIDVAGSALADVTWQNHWSHVYGYDGLDRLIDAGLGQLDDANTDNTPDLPAPAETWTDREYVYGPDEADEFILQEDRDYNTTFFLQDQQGSVVGLTDSLGLMAMWRAYEPYGRTMQEVDYGGSTPTRVGFQGLFFDRFNGTVADSAVAPDALGVYYARNRHYSPTLGRWIQRDPNATAMPVIEALAFNGNHANLPLKGVNLQAQFGDGMNLYQFVGFRKS